MITSTSRLDLHFRLEEKVHLAAKGARPAVHSLYNPEATHSMARPKHVAGLLLAGDGVALFAAEHYARVLSELPSFKAKRYSKALVGGFGLSCCKEESIAQDGDGHGGLRVV